jgi:hypothetical protein
VFVAITYALTVFTVSGLLWFARRQHRTKREIGELFAYPSVYRYFAAFMILFFLAAGFYATHGGAAKRPAEFESTISWLMAGGFCGLAMWALLLFTRYSISIVGTTVRINGILTERSFDLREVREAVVLEGYRGARDLLVSDASGQILMKVGSTIQDFDDLIDVLRRGLAEYGVAVRRRDMMGNVH